jgi:hypothetical protein
MMEDACRDDDYGSWLRPPPAAASKGLAAAAQFIRFSYISILGFID